MRHPARPGLRRRRPGPGKGGVTAAHARRAGSAAVAIAVALATFPGSAWAEAAAIFSQGGPDAAAYGAEQGYPVGRPAAVMPQRGMVGYYSHADTVIHAHRIAAAPSPSPLRRARDELALSYSFQGRRSTLADYLERNPATGLLIARDDTILFEHYRYARTDKDRFLSQSMAKTVTAMLLGIAVGEGAIRSIDQPVSDYVPDLAGTAYGATRIRDLLHMASGVAFHEAYDGADDIAALGRALFVHPGIPAARAVARFNTREAEPGTRFHYASVETEILGLVLANAAHQTLSSYLESRIWQPMGAEAEASWQVDLHGQEAAYCCFSATLRDWARFALLLAHDGVANGRQIIPRDWLLASTTPQADFLRPRVAAQFMGYGNQVWLFPGQRRQFALLGVHGQAIFVDPAARLVLVHTAVRVKPTGDPGSAELAALWRALVAQVAPGGTQ